MPHVFCWPGHIPPGTSCDQPVTSVDLYPTLLEVANARPPTEYTLDGVGYLSLLTSGGKSRLDREAIYWHFPGYLGAGKGQWRTLPVGVARTGDFKLMEFFEDGRFELYNLRQDPGETNNLAESMPDKATELRARLHAWQQQVGAPMPKPHQEAAQEPKKAGKRGKRAGKSRQGLSSQ